jgi:O-antigen/teichoic acid export membrane protein
MLHMSSEEDQRRFLKVILPTFMVQVAGMAISFCISLLMTRVMGAASYGVYVYCFSVVMGLVNFIVYGPNILALRETSSLLALKKNGQWKGFIRWNIYSLLILSTSVSVVAALIFYFFPVLPDNSYRIPILIACTCIPLYSFLLLLSSVLRGLHKVLLSQLSEKLIRPVALLLMLTLLYIFERHIALYPALLFNSLSFLACVLFVAWQYRVESSPILKNIEPEYETSRWRKEVSGLFLFGIFMSIESQIDVYMLAYLKPSAEVGIYNIANTVAGFTSFFLGISNVVLAPSFAHLHTLQNREKLQHLITQTIRWVMLLTTPLALFTIFFSHWILSLWGPEFVKGQWALIMLCSAHLINSAFGSVGNLALMSKFERYNGIAITISIVINIVLNLLLTPQWGLNGTAFASALSILVWNVTLFVIVKKKTGISTWVFLPGNNKNTGNE